jgi:HEAT repeat protein
MCCFFSIRVLALTFACFALLESAVLAQDWRTSGEDPCACSDSMPFIVGPRPPVDTPAQIATLVRDSADPSCRVARLAVEALRNADRDARATGALVTLLTADACALRASAAWSLIKHRSPAIAPALTRVLADPDRRVRQAAAYGLGYHGDLSAVTPLTALLGDASKHVRQSAAEALGRIGDSSARAPLTRLLEDPEPHVRDAAVEALRRLR